LVGAGSGGRLTAVTRPPDDDGRSVRVAPAGGGAPVTFTFTDFPGVRLAAGSWFGDRFPECGCDACDEQPGPLEEQLRELVADVVAGRLREWWDGERLGFDRPHRRGWSLVTDPAVRAGLGPPAERRWPPWPRRPGASG
jgi:hypothetical protein